MPDIYIMSLSGIKKQTTESAIQHSECSVLIQTL